MNHTIDETALSNNVIASNGHSGQQGLNQSVSASDYLGLNPGPPITGHMSLSHSFNKRGHDGY